MDETQELDRFSAWLNVALRKAALSFEDGRKEDDATLPPGHEGKSGRRLKAALSRMDRTVLPLLDEFNAKVVELRPSAAQLARGASAIEQFLETMAKNVRYLAGHVDGAGGDATAQIERRIASLQQDVRNHLAAANRGAAPGALPLSFVPQALAAIGPTIDIEEAAHRLCGDRRIEDTDLWLDQATGSARFRATVRGKELTPDENAERVRRLGAAVELIHDALCGAELHAIVWSSKQGTSFTVPRYYWKHRAAHSILGGLSDAMAIAGGDESMTGKPALAVAEFGAWMKSARAKLGRQCASRALNPSSEKVIVTSTAGAITECEAWLRDQFADEATGNIARDSFKAEALDKFAGRLSGRGFMAAWARATKDFPERVRAGRRK